MHTTLPCPGCRQELRIPTESLGKRVRCPACRCSFPTRPENEAITAAEPPLKMKPVDPEPRRSKRRVSAEAEEFAAEVMAKVERDERSKPANYGMPAYLTLLAILPWGIVVLTCGGCIPFAIAAGLSSAGFGIARSTQTPVPLRLLGLIALNAFGYIGTLVFILFVAIALNGGNPFGGFKWPSFPGPAPGPINQPPPNQPPNQPPVEKPPPYVPPKTPPAATQFPGLLGYWDFEQMAGNRVSDLSGKGNHATAVNAASGKGIRGQGVQLGGNAHIDYGTDRSLDFPANSSFTVAGWIKTNADTGMILSQRHSEDDGAVIDVSIEPGGVLKALMRQDRDFFPHALSTRFPVNDGQWHHFAFTRNGNAILELFLDGKSEQQGGGVGSGGSITTNLRAVGREQRWLQLGHAAYNGVNAQLSGSVDEVCIFNRDLRQDEIRSLAGR